MMASVLRQLLKGSAPVVAPGVYDCLSALVAERTGFQAVFVSGAAVSASILGLPDLGLMTMSETLAQTRSIVTATRLPVIADCDTGYGNPINVRRTVREFQAAGVAALFIEDQTFPKRCGHFEGKDVISSLDMIQKLRAAVDARADSDLVIIARTDAVAVEGLEKALERAAAYGHAGADMIFFDAPRSVDEVKSLATGCSIPLMINLVEGGKTPLMSVDELSSLGFKLITFSGTLQRAAIGAMEKVGSHLKSTGEVASLYPTEVVSLDHRSEILRLADYKALEARYRSDD